MAPFAVYNDELGRSTASAKRGRTRLSKIRPLRKSKPLNNTPRPQLAAHRTSIILQGTHTLDELSYSSDVFVGNTHGDMNARNYFEGSSSHRNKPLPPTPGKKSQLRRMHSNPDLSKARPRAPEAFSRPYGRFPNQSMAHIGYIHTPGLDDLPRHNATEPVLGDSYPKEFLPLREKSTNINYPKSDLTFNTGSRQETSKKSGFGAFFRKAVSTDRRRTVSKPKSSYGIDTTAILPLDPPYTHNIQESPVSMENSGEYFSPANNELDLAATRHADAALVPTPLSDESNPRMTALPQSRSQYGLPGLEDSRRRPGVMGKMKDALSNLKQPGKHKRSATVIPSELLKGNVQHNLARRSPVLQKRFDLDDSQSSSIKSNDSSRHSVFPRLKGPTKKLQKQAARTPDQSTEDLDYQDADQKEDMPIESTRPLTEDHTPLLLGYNPSKPWPQAFVDHIGIEIAPRMVPINPLRQHTNVMEFAKPPPGHVVHSINIVDVHKPSSAGGSIQSEPVRNRMTYSRSNTPQLSSYYSEPTSPERPSTSSSGSPPATVYRINRHTVTGAKNQPSYDYSQMPLPETRFSLDQNSKYGSPIPSSHRNVALPSPSFSSQYSLNSRPAASDIRHVPSGENRGFDLTAHPVDPFAHFGTANSSSSSSNLFVGVSKPVNIARGGNSNPRHRLASMPGGALPHRPSQSQSYPGTYENRRQGLALQDSPLKRTSSSLSNYEFDEASARLFNGKSWTNPPDYSGEDLDENELADFENAILMARHLSMIPELNEHRKSASSLARHRSTGAASCPSSLKETKGPRSSLQSTGSTDLTQSQRSSGGSSMGSGKTLRRSRATKLSASLSQKERESISSVIYGKDVSTEPANEEMKNEGDEASRRDSIDSKFSIASSLRDIIDDYGADGFEICEARAVPIIFSGKARLIDIPPRRRKDP